MKNKNKKVPRNQSNDNDNEFLKSRHYFTKLSRRSVSRFKYISSALNYRDYIKKQSDGTANT